MQNTRSPFQGQRSAKVHMLLRRTCSSCKPLKTFRNSKGAHTAYLLTIRSFAHNVHDSRVAPCHETLTLLHKTVKLLPRALPSKSHTSPCQPAESLEFWDDILSGVYEDLTSAAGRPARIAGSSLKYTIGL
jgi:hypothetical protein